VATIRALKMHGGVAKADLNQENLDAVRMGLANLERHTRNVRKFGVPPVVAVNQFISDTSAEHALVLDYCRETLGVEAFLCSHWADGGAGIEALAQHVATLADRERAAGFRTLYPDALPLLDKIRTIATEIYDAADVVVDGAILKRLAELEEAGYGYLPICIAKTQYSFSTDPNSKGAPSGHKLPVREVRLSGGAEFLVVVCGDIMTMPGLPRVPAAHGIRLDETGLIQGLF
ncbi:MAG: formate--tetrahydrofolate ligase, partial [Pseudomonadota bacterium]